MTNTQIIAAALRQALAGEAITDTDTLQQALRELAYGTDFHFVGIEAVKALLDYTHSDLQAKRQMLMTQISAARGDK
jgi:predicted metal-dependent phosphoesterase TrpH